MKFTEEQRKWIVEEFEPRKFVETIIRNFYPKFDVKGKKYDQLFVQIVHHFRERRSVERSKVSGPKKTYQKLFGSEKLFPSFCDKLC